MKRTLAFFLSCLMLLPLFGCATSPTSESKQQNDIDILSGEELTRLIADPQTFSKVVAADDAYIRGGSYGNTNMNSAKKKDGLLELKKGPADYTRDILLRFDLTQMKLEGKTRVVIMLDFAKSNMTSTEKNAVCAYGIENDWSSETVTFNNAPKYDASNMLGRGVMSKVGNCIIDVTDYVLDAYDAGETSVSFRLTAETAIGSQSQAAATTFSFASRRPMLFADTMQGDETYRTDFTIDPYEAKYMFDRANTLFEDWYARYQEILAKGEADIIGVGRQTLADPDLPLKLRTGREDEIINCLRCYNCFNSRYGDRSGYGACEAYFQPPFVKG